MSARDEAAAAKPTVYLRDWKKAAQKEHDDLIELRIKTAEEDEIVALPNFIDGYGAGLRAGWDAGREELQKRIKDLDEAACELLTGWDSLVAANAELQRELQMQSELVRHGSEEVQDRNAAIRELQRRIDAALFLILKTQRLNLMDYQKNEIVAVLTAEEQKR